MLASPLLAALAATVQTPSAAAPPVQVRAQAQVFVQIIQAAEVRNGRSDTPHQRTVRRDEAGQTQTLLQFE
ncbi:hypothetical protein GGQ97_000679 [Sphingomonas kaistensis]|uniref:Uncharacterized protein n=1 Tax=Sphingomonas kaistensis TaxID=298708 RepID=A0A7X5Y7D1_9SPHN|nr:hypothetical protein [Sphingomonas kaistensis]NJC04886.1 hypothetical protein [Sphingomonas kaistensis]